MTGTECPATSIDALSVPLCRFTRYIAAVTLVLFAIGCAGGTIPRSEIEKDPAAALTKDDRIASVVLLSDSTVTFDGNGGTYTSQYNRIHGTTKDGTWAQIPMEEVAEVQLKRSGGGKAVAIIVVVGAVVALGLLMVGALVDTQIPD